MTRIVVSILYAFLVGSMFISSAYDRQNLSWSETEAAGLIGTLFLSLNVVGTTGEGILFYTTVDTIAFTHHLS